MKGRIQVVVLENEKLHEELKTLTVEQTLREQMLLDASVSLIHFFLMIWDNYMILVLNISFFIPEAQPDSSIIGL